MGSAAQGAAENQGAELWALSAHRSGIKPTARLGEQADRRSSPRPGLGGRGPRAARRRERCAQKREATARSLGCAQPLSSAGRPPMPGPRRAGRSCRPCPGRPAGGGQAGAGRARCPGGEAGAEADLAGARRTCQCPRGTWSLRWPRGRRLSSFLAGAQYPGDLPPLGSRRAVGRVAPRRAAPGGRSCPRPGGSVGRPSREGTDATHACALRLPPPPTRRHRGAPDAREAGWKRGAFAPFLALPRQTQKRNSRIIRKNRKDPIPASPPPTSWRSRKWNTRCSLCAPQPRWNPVFPRSHGSSSSPGWRIIWRRKMIHQYSKKQEPIVYQEMGHLHFMCPGPEVIIWEVGIQYFFHVWIENQFQGNDDRAVVTQTSSKQRSRERNTILDMPPRLKEYCGRG
uniref:translation initiation factor IF-2-like n=1 Tax=Jaculus jaculus TaxID=51337 RepID=UPI001E1B0B83|nr:translation initiation factor IF-2-like [Jaculus jaculus]